MKQTLRQLYTECLNCSLRCPKAWKDRRKGIIPRGFEPPLSKRTKLLVVAKNPGHPLVGGGECELYKGRKGKALFDSNIQWRSQVLKLLATKDSSLKYHKNRNRYIRFILGHSKKLETFREYTERIKDAEVLKKDHTRILRSVAMTNLFKCSTKDEQEKLKARDVAACYNRFFSKEVDLIRPRAILAFGNEVFSILQKLDTEGKLPPVVPIRHPSYFYPKESERTELRRIKKKFLK